MSLTRAREAAVLAIVMAHPAHGYDIAAAFDRGPLQFLGLKKSATYGILKRLVERGWITEQPEPGTSYPDRMICHPTDAGRAGLEGLLSGMDGEVQSPLIALTMLHDAGHDVAQLAQTALARREALLAQVEAAGHPGETSALANALLRAEVETLTRITDGTTKGDEGAPER